MPTGSVDPDGIIADYSWNFGDGGVSRGNLVQHTFTAAGTYQVELRVVDNDSAIATAFTTIVVGSAPEASFTFDAGRARRRHRRRSVRCLFLHG